MIPSVLQLINYFLTEHPIVVGFRWSMIESWVSTWSFLVFSISAYITTAVVLHVFLFLVRRNRPVPLGPIPAVHSLGMSLLFAVIFAGTLLSSAAEIRETRWFWRRFKTPFEWLFCFPLGTRSSGRVFFWSYIFYLSRFLHLFRTYFTILRRRTLSVTQLFNHSTLICMSFLWLEFSQSYQVLEILLMTLTFALVYGYRVWTEIGLPKAHFRFIMNFHLILLACNLIGHGVVFLLHFKKGGCNGIGAWIFNSILGSIALLIFLKFYIKLWRFSRKTALSLAGDQGEPLISETKSQHK